MKLYRWFGWTYVGACTAVIVSSGGSRPRATPTPNPPPRPAPPAPEPNTAAGWFRRAKPYCNTVEVATIEQRLGRPPATPEGIGYHAACLALAGRVDDARRVIDQLPEESQRFAANVVFNVGHPVADAGDDRSAGPIMELVIDYWPDHYMALYHAGMSEYMLGQRDLARHNLGAFLKYYHENDGWRSNAVDVLRRLADSAGAEVDPRRPREPQE
jgi:tetratricopeptide (TPR) repeat protein